MADASTAPDGTDPTAGDPLAAQLRGFGALGILSILFILAANLTVAPLSALLVLAWARLSRTPWREIGYVRPRSWTRVVVPGVLFGVAFKFLMKMVVMPLLGADPVNRAYHYLAGNPAALPGILFAVTVGAGFGEETFYRGYLFERLGRRLGRSVGATIAIVVLTSALFGLAHYPDQGLPGVQQAIITGLTFGTIFAVTGSIWLVMVAHAAFDVTAVWMIYSNLETKIAHFIFK